MDIVNQSIFIIFIHAIFSIIMPGFAFYLFLKKRYKLRQDSTIEKLLVSFGIGVFINSLEFFLVLLLVGCIRAEISLLVYIKYSFDLFLCIYLLLNCIKGTSFNKFDLKKTQFFINSIIIITLAIFGFFVTRRFPHVFDSSQLVWTHSFISGSCPAFPAATGAIGYSALIFFPGVLFKSIPLVTLASGYKVFLPLLLFLSVVFIGEKLKYRNTMSFGFIFFLIIMTSYFGIHGVMELGKDSVFGVLFSVMFVGTIIKLKDDNYYFFKSALFFSCAIMTGVITIPYLCLITLFFLVLSFGKFPVFKFILYITTVSIVGFLISMNAMLKIPLLYLFILISGLIGLSFGLRKKRFNFRFEEKSKKIIVPIVIIVVVICGLYLMPASVFIGANVNSVGEIINVSLPPLDGKTTFWKYLFETDKYLSGVIIFVGFLGLFLVCLNKRNGDDPGIQALALFPFSMLLLVLILITTKTSLFTAFNYWDMTKDIPQWYGGIIFGFFALLLVDAIAFNIRNDNLQNKFILLCYVGVGIISFLSAGKEIIKIRNSAYMTSIGGHRNQYYAKLFEAVYFVPNVKTLFIPRTSIAQAMFFQFPMYKGVYTYSYSYKNESEIISINKHVPTLVISKPDKIISISKSINLYKKVIIKKITFFKENGESLYLIVDGKL